MSINRKDYLNVWFYEDEKRHRWLCSSCQKGFLILDSKTFHKFETSKLIEGLSPDEFVQYAYACVFRCNNALCQKAVMSIGQGEVVNEPTEWVYDEQYGDVPVKSDYIDRFCPKLFQPHIHIFPVNSHVPEDIAQKIHDSFKLFFVSPSAAASQARIALELMLDYFKVDRYSGGQRLALGKRIELAPSPLSDFEEMLKAIKWLGNDGSHEVGMSDENVLDLYEILEKVINEVFAQETDAIARLARRINTTKKQVPFSSSSNIAKRSN